MSDLLKPIVDTYERMEETQKELKQINAELIAIEKDYTNALEEFMSQTEDINELLSAQKYLDQAYITSRRFNTALKKCAYHLPGVKDVSDVHVRDTLYLTMDRKATQEDIEAILRLSYSHDHITYFAFRFGDERNIRLNTIFGAGKPKQDNFQITKGEYVNAASLARKIIKNNINA